MKLDKRLVLGVFLVLFTVTSFADFPQTVFDVRNDAYASWSKTEKEDQLTWINGVLSGLHYLAVRYASEKRDSRILEYVPNGLPSNQIQSIVDRVYRNEANRLVPIVDIVIRAKEWKQALENQGGNF
jgi:hypothetical protein